MRIIAGTAKGHSLVVPKTGVRPTSERVRESIFNRITARNIEWESTRVLDLFAGSGACALEALSRGAQRATAIDKNSDAVQSILRNSEKTKLSLDVIHGDVTKLVRNHRSDSFNLLFIDPPYEFLNESVTQLLVDLKDSGLLEERGIGIIERSSRSDDFAIPEGFTLDDVRTYGDTRVFWLVW